MLTCGWPGFDAWRATARGAGAPAPFAWGDGAPGRAAVRVASARHCAAAKRVSAAGAGTPRQMVHRAMVGAGPSGMGEQTKGPGERARLPPPRAPASLLRQ